MFKKRTSSDLAARVAGLESLIHQTAQNQRQQLEHLAMLQGRALALQNADRAPLKKLQDAEFKVFSQYGEDGILQYLIREAGITAREKTFIEFGVQDYAESNTRFLLMNDNWRGLILDGSSAYMNTVKNQDLYWRYDLTAVAAWIDRDNINDLITSAGFQGDLGILSVDIDGNDYWVWEAITSVNPVIVVVEWNSVFGPTHAVSVPYDPAFDRHKAHYSALFWGASIGAFTHLARKKGYALLGSNTAGNNLFFVRKDRLGRLAPVTAEEAHVVSRFRDSRDKQGNLNYLGGDKRLSEILDVPLVDVVRNTTCTLRHLNQQS
jgi:hypothetical protein